MDEVDVVVIGAGHAGCEAAYAAARMGCHVGLCTLSNATVAHMPCNPAIGGTAKGHLVREIDALGGLMGTAIDATGLQFKLLNRSRGPAVWSPRAQADKKQYGAWVKRELTRQPGIDWIIGRVGEVLVEHGRVVGVALEEGPRHTRRVVWVNQHRISWRSHSRRLASGGEGLRLEPRPGSADAALTSRDLRRHREMSSLCLFPSCPTG